MTIVRKQLTSTDHETILSLLRASFGEATFTGIAPPKDVFLHCQYFTVKGGHIRWARKHFRTSFLGWFLNHSTIGATEWCMYATDQEGMMTIEDFQTAQAIISNNLNKLSSFIETSQAELNSIKLG